MMKSKIFAISLFTLAAATCVFALVSTKSFQQKNSPQTEVVAKEQPAAKVENEAPAEKPDRASGTKEHSNRALKKMIQGEWVLQDFATTGDGNNQGFEEAKKSKTRYYFKDGKSGRTPEVSEFQYDFKDGDLYMWSPRSPEKITSVEDAIKKSPATLLVGCVFSEDGKTMTWSVDKKGATAKMVYQKVNSL